MKTVSLKHKLIALMLVLIFVSISLQDINDLYKSPGVYICGKLAMCDPTPAHLSYYCDQFH